MKKLGHFLLFRRSTLRLYLWVFFLLPFFLSAQISVTKFERQDLDLTARTNPVEDVNGRKCALIRIETTLKDLRFEPDGFGICNNPIYKTGEVWIYVPPGANRLSIYNDKVGVLRDYLYPENLLPATTYLMVLKNATITTLVDERLTHNWVEITLMPIDALLYINNELKTTKNGVFSERLEVDKKHKLKVEAPLYHTYLEDIYANDSETVYKNVKLLPNFGTLKLTLTPETGAQVIIDGKSVGTTPYTDQKLQSGTHQLQIVKEMYQTVNQTITIEDTKTTEITIALPPNFAEPIFKVDNNAEIWINGVLKGTGTYSARLTAGNYLIETKMLSHLTIKKSIDLANGDKKEIILDNPVPICGKLDISSNPSGATLMLNGKEYGKTPKIDAKVLIGNYTLRVSKQGFLDVEQKVTVEEGKMITLELALEEIKQYGNLNITSSPSGAKVTIRTVDGTIVEKGTGTSPMDIKLLFGKYSVEFEHDECLTVSKEVIINKTTTTFLSASLTKIQQLSFSDFKKLKHSEKLQMLKANTAALKAYKKYKTMNGIGATLLSVGTVSAIMGGAIPFESTGYKDGNGNWVEVSKQHGALNWGLLGAGGALFVTGIALLGANNLKTTYNLSKKRTNKALYLTPMPVISPQFTGLNVKF